MESRYYFPQNDGGQFAFLNPRSRNVAMRRNSEVVRRTADGTVRRTIRHAKSLNFEEYASEGNHFINLVARELRTDRNRAARITRAVLHAIRDRMPASEAIQFMQGLPMMIKAIFVDQYDISKAPVLIRNSNDFLDFIYQKDGRSAQRDFPDQRSVIQGLRAVFRVLQYEMDFGQIEQMKHVLHSDILRML